VAAWAGWPAARSRADSMPMRLNYGSLPCQYVDITVPAGSSPTPVVVIVHGGFWSSGYGAELGRDLAADLARRGFAAVNVEYRRLGVGPDGGGGWPQTGADVATALDALGGDGQRLANGRLDLNRIVALGHSAGGQLAGWLAARRGPVKLSGVVSQAGVLDMVRAAETDVGGGAVDEFLGGSPSQVPGAYADASPMARVPLGVPSICVHGRSDSAVPIEQSERFVAAARGAGDRSELRAFDGGHFDLIEVGSPAWSMCVSAVSDLTGR
jgi:acetyl esterase/lipase